MCLCWYDLSNSVCFDESIREIFIYRFFIVLSSWYVLYVYRLMYSYRAFVGRLLCTSTCILFVGEFYPASLSTGFHQYSPTMLASLVTLGSSQPETPPGLALKPFSKPLSKPIWNCSSGEALTGILWCVHLTIHSVFSQIGMLNCQRIWKYVQIIQLFGYAKLRY